MGFFDRLFCRGSNSKSEPKSESTSSSTDTSLGLVESDSEWLEYKIPYTKKLKDGTEKTYYKKVSYCSKCGYKNAIKTNFCPDCGKRCKK